MRIALLGYGVETQSAYKYFSEIYPDAQFTVYENAPEPKFPVPKGVEFYGGLENFFDINADLVIKTPAIPPSKVSSKGKITSVTKEFLTQCPAPIIGVTGTKGKGTTCSLITEILKSAGKKVWLVGNIGVPALDVLNDVEPDDIVVYEMSSFQLWDLDRSPHVAVILMIEEEHLDVHESNDDYVNAKANIVINQSTDDFCIYFVGNEKSRHIGESTKAQKIPFNVEEDETIKVDGRDILSKSDIKLIGEHNLQNVYAAVHASLLFTKDHEAIAKAISNFKGLPHRLSFVREVNGVKYFDDSISTTPESAIAAIKSFNQPKVIILGGRSKGANFESLAEIVKQTNTKAILNGAEAKNIASCFENLGYKGYYFSDAGMHSIIEKASGIAKPGHVVLLSPACSSLGDFKDYKDRGDQYAAAVQSL